MLYQRVDHCRACGSSDITQVLNLGVFAISDFLESPDAFTDRAPLELVRCHACTLVQLQHTVDRQRLYSHYWYRSATQPAMVRALRDVVTSATSRVCIGPRDVVLDIGANDGTLLRLYPKGTYTIGVDPAENIFADADETHRGFWPLPYELEHKPKVITSIACFYDADDPNAFVAAIKDCLAPDGIWVNQMAYLPDTINTGNFGDICHEHLTYWTLGAFTRLLAKHKLAVESVYLNDVNGGSLRTIVRHQSRVSSLLAGESLDFTEFSERMLGQRHEILKFLSNHTGIIGYGASTKGNTYLQYWGVTPNLVDSIADRNPDKWGKYTPMGQKVISEAEMRQRNPNYLLVLPFHFIEAFVDRERNLLAQGTRMMVPFPSLHFVGGEDAHLQSEATVPDDGAAVRS